MARSLSYVVAMAGVVWGMLLLNETPTPWVWAGLACLLGGLILVRPRDDKVEDPTRHLPQQA